MIKGHHPSPCHRHRRGAEPPERWRSPERPSTPLFDDIAPRRSPARVQPTRLARVPACSCLPRSCASQAIEPAHHAPHRSRAIAVVVASCSVKLTPNAQGSLAAPTMSAVAVAVAVMRSTSGKRKLVALMQMQLTHWVAGRLDPPCLGCAGSHSPLSDPRSGGYSARVARHCLFTEMRRVIRGR